MGERKMVGVKLGSSGGVIGLFYAYGNIISRGWLSVEPLSTWIVAPVYLLQPNTDIRPTFVETFDCGVSSLHKIKGFEGF